MTRPALVMLLMLLAGEARGQNAPWSVGTAYTVPRGRLEVGLFQPLRYGVTDTIEVATHPLLDVLMPNVAVKKIWLEVWDGQLASRHNLSYPTGLLTVLSRDGTGGVLPGDTKVPHILAFTSEALFSRELAGDHLWTAKLGATLAAHFGHNTLPTIDLPLAYTRTAAYHEWATFDIGLDVDGPLWGPFSYLLDGDLFLIPVEEAFWAVEQSGMITWHATPSFVVQAGYKIVYGMYPFGHAQLHLLPLADVMWALD